jgi:two-component system alkaline phosphatase synthesis response regulator PhoP
MSAMKKQPLVLLVDDDPDILETMKAVLESRPYRLATARDGQQCLARVQEEPPDLILLDMLMPRMDGFAVIKELHSDPRYAGIPVVVLTTLLEDAAYRRYELETGRSMEVQAYLEKPTPPAELLRLVGSIVDQPYIIVADDDPDILEAMSTILRSGPYRIGTARDGDAALALVRKRQPDLLVLDLLMPKKDGFAVIRELRADPGTADVPILVLTTVVEDASRRRYALETGRDMAVQAYLQKPAPPAELMRVVAELLEKVAA